MKKFLATAMAISFFALSAHAQYYGNYSYNNQGYGQSRGQYQNQGYNNQGYGRSQGQYRNQGNRNRQGSSYQRRGQSSRVASRKQQQQDQLSFYIAPRVGVGTSFGWVSELDNPVVPQLAIAGGLSYGNWRAELEFDYHFEGELGSWSDEDEHLELNFSQYNFAVNGYYDFMPNSSFRPFIGLGLGVSKVEITEEYSSPYGSYSESVSDTNPMFSAMGGATWRLSDHLSLEGMARYRYVSVDADAGSGISNVEALIGMRFNF